MYKLYHLSLIFQGVPKMRDLEVAFSDPGDDWIRVSPTTWLVWSDKHVSTIYGRLRPLLDLNDFFMITEMDPRGTAGYMLPWVWHWINSKVPGSVIVHDTLPQPTQPNRLTTL